MSDPTSIGIAGTGNIACGLALACAPHLEVRLFARSPESAARAHAALERMRRSAPGGPIAIEDRLEALGGCAILVEAVAEDLAVKAQVLRALAALPGDATLVTTTSSLPLDELARASGAPARVAAVHVFTPVYQVPLVELAFPDEASAATRATAHALCGALGKTVIEVPAVPGFVVNRLVFPMLLAAVETLELTGVAPEAIDEAMCLSLGHPVGPLRTLDLIGLDVSLAIAERLDLAVPPTLRQRVAAGALGRKARRGFYAYGSPKAIGVRTVG